MSDASTMFDAKLDKAWKLLGTAYADVDKMNLSERQRDILRVRLDVARHQINDAADRAKDMIGMNAWEQEAYHRKKGA